MRTCQRIWAALAVCVCLVAGSGRAWAQSPFITGQLTSATCPGTGCVSLSVSGLGSVGVTVTGTWSGTLLVEVATDGVHYSTLLLNPSDGTSAVSSVTSNGAW